MENNKPKEAPNAPAAENASPEEKKVNKKTVITVVAIVLAIVIIGLIWYFVSASASKKADEAIGRADIEVNDSLALDLYKQAAQLGKKSGNRAGLEVAIRLYDKGDYKGAIEYLDKASVDSKVVEAGKYSLMGDCYVNLKDYDKALSSYDKAISAADGNPQIVPFVMVKKANIYRAQGKHAEEYDTYEAIFNKYPEYANTIGANQGMPIDIRKYAERARVAAGK